jgi:hypothetical protein
MARLPPPPTNYDAFDPVIDFSVKDLAIGGKLVKVVHEISGYDVAKCSTETEFKNYVKRTLAMQLATYMIEHNLVEFTQFENLSTQMHTVAARCYLAPNEQVKLLRIHDK